jgi:hypothetical protein
VNNITAVCNKEHRITPGECALCERDASEHNFSIEHAALVEACKVRDELKRRLEKSSQAVMVAAERALYDDALILKLDDTLAKAVEVIKQWHNMGGGEDVWQIYYENAPEMQPIRTLLTRSTDRRE